VWAGGLLATGGNLLRAGAPGRLCSARAAHGQRDDVARWNRAGVESNFYRVDPLGKPELDSRRVNARAVVCVTPLPGGLAVALERYQFGVECGFPTVERPARSNRPRGTP
jgi:hypothetical protein